MQMQIYINCINTFGPAADHQHEEEEANLHISSWVTRVVTLTGLSLVSHLILCKVDVIIIWLCLPTLATKVLHWIMNVMDKNWRCNHFKNQISRIILNSLPASWQFRPENWSTHLVEAGLSWSRGAGGVVLVVAAKRYLYHAGYYILNSSAIKLCDAWQAPLSLPLALSSHKRGMLAPLPSREGLNHWEKVIMNGPLD